MPDRLAALVQKEGVQREGRADEENVHRFATGRREPNA